MALGFHMGGSNDLPEPVALIPTMTGTSTPSGTVIFSTQLTPDPYSGVYYYAWKAFDGDDSTAISRWSCAGSKVGDYLGYNFPTAVKAKRIRVKHGNNSNTKPKYIIQASNDGNTWTNLTDTITATTVEGGWDDIELNTTQAYTYYRLYYTYWSGVSSYSIFTMQLYSR